MTAPAAEAIAGPPAEGPNPLARAILAPEAPAYLLTEPFVPMDLTIIPDAARLEWVRSQPPTRMACENLVDGWLGDCSVSLEQRRAWVYERGDAHVTTEMPAITAGPLSGFLALPSPPLAILAPAMVAETERQMTAAEQAGRTIYPELSALADRDDTEALTAVLPDLGSGDDR